NVADRSRGTQTGGRRPEPCGMGKAPGDDEAGALQSERRTRCRCFPKGSGGMNFQPENRQASAGAVPVEPLMSERRVSIIGGLIVAIGPISLALFTPAMPEIAHAFGTSEGAVKLTLSLYFAGFAFAQLFCGPLSDGFGRKPVTFAFMAIYLVASLIALLAPSIEVLIAARFLQGVGAAVGVAISRAIVRDLFTHERSARIMNLIGI